MSRSFYFYLEIFKRKFIPYFSTIEFINEYNLNYTKNIINYKLSVLNKISNLKRFFYRQNKSNVGLKIFSYLNCFSLKFHMKHLL